MAARQTGMILMVVVLSLLGLVQCFQPLFTFDGNSTTHRDITQRAVLIKTAEVCRDIAASEGRDFSLTVSCVSSLKPKLHCAFLFCELRTYFHTISHHQNKAEK